MRTFYKAKGLLALLGLCLLSGLSFSQSISGYGFSALSGTFTPITGGTATSLAATDDDVMSTAFPIGFTFAYGGVDFTQVQASSNGTLLFGTGKTQSATNNLATATASQRPGLAPLWDDLQTTAGVKYTLTGTAPNRILTVEWLNMEWNYQSNTGVISFQVILKETSNIIDFVYRQEATAYSAGTTGGASIGIMGSTATNFISLQDATAAPAISLTTSMNALTTKPATGQIYRFTPPTCPQPSSLVLTTATATSATLDWNGSTETTWTIEYGAQGFTVGTGTFATFTGTSAGTINGLLPNTAYQAYATAICSPTDSSANSIPVSFTTLPTCPQPTATTLTSATTTSAILDWTPGGTETMWTVEYGPTGFTSGTGTFTTVSGTSATTLNGLVAGTFYQAYVTAVCSPTDSSTNSTVINFNTYGIAQYMEADAVCGTGFTDISTTGTTYTLGDDDETGFTLPFNFYYQGTLVTTMTIGNNGAIFFGALNQQVGFGNTAIGAATVTGVYPFWDDLGTAGAGVYSQVIGTAPNRKAIIQWNKQHLGATGTDLIFQVVMDEATGEIYYNYDNTVVGNTTYDNGAAATVGIAGPNQDIQISFNNATYLANNTCAHFYYTDCPKPTALTFSNITASEFTADWNAGISAETAWIVEYGAQGFTPGTGTMLNGITSSDTQVPDLDPITVYDVYVYAACANGDTSVALMGSVQTLPLCSNPYGVTGTALAEDSISATWLWTETVSSLTSFNLQYVPNGSVLYGPNATVVEADGMNFADTIVDADLMAGMTYKVYVQAVCGTDTSNYIGPFTVTMPLTNDSVCMPEHLMVDGTVYTFTNAGATASNLVSTNLEQSIAPPNTGLQTTTGWGNSSISFSTWFTFTAPASGQVRISGKDANFDGQIAVYTAGNCSQFSTFTLVAANDNEIGGTSAAPNFTVCGLTPGNTYYLMHDSYSTFTTGTYSIKITPINLEAGSTAALLEICTGDSVNLYDGINGYQDNGVWSPVISSIALVQDSLFASAGLAYQTFQFQYRLTDGCAYDSILANVKVFPPSHAGIDGSLVVCRNEPFNLVEGLDGTIDLNGTWYNPGSAVVPDGSTVGDNMPGQYNYKYIVGNGVCPNDTSKVIVSVQNTCNYLGLEEAAFEGFNLYPNPTEGSVYISNSGLSDVFSYEVLDLNGRKVAMKENAINGTTVTEIDLNNMETGIYMIHVYNGSAEKTFRVVVK